MYNPLKYIHRIYTRFTIVPTPNAVSLACQLWCALEQISSKTVVGTKKTLDYS